MKTLMNQVRQGVVKRHRKSRGTCEIEFEGIDDPVQTYHQDQLGGVLPEPGTKVAAIITIVSLSD